MAARGGSCVSSRRPSLSAPAPCSSSLGKRGSSSSNLRGGRIPKGASDNEEEDDGLHGGRMKPLSSLCGNRRPLAPLVRCGSARLKRPAPAADCDKENAAPSKKRTTRDNQQSSTSSGSMDMLFLALDSCSKKEPSRAEKKSVALKRFCKLRSSLTSSKKRRAEDGGEQPGPETRDENKEQFPVCLTSTQDIQELPLLDRAEAKSGKEVVVRVEELSDGDDQDVSLRLSVGADTACSRGKPSENEELDFKPGILNRARDSKKVKAILGALGGGEDPEENHRLAGSSCKSELTQAENDKEASNSRQDTESLFMTPIFANTAVNVAARWLDLLSLDLKGRLAALKRSRRNVRGVILSGQFGKVRGHSRFVKRDNEADKWLTLFMNMDTGLAAEGAKLEISLRKVQDMQRNCEFAPSNVDRIAHFPQAAGASQQPPAEPAVNRTMALAASAAAICSTADFLVNNC